MVPNMRSDLVSNMRDTYRKSQGEYLNLLVTVAHLCSILVERLSCFLGYRELAKVIDFRTLCIITLIEN
jgi:hypothetical protein